MKRLLFLTILGPFCLMTAQAQYQELEDSIRLILESLPSDAERVDSLIEWSYGRVTPPEAYLFASAALQLSTPKENRTGRSFFLASPEGIVRSGPYFPSGYRKGQGLAMVKLGHIALDSGYYQRAESWYLHAVDIRLELGDSEGVASCYNNLGNTRKQQGQYEAAVEYFEKGLAIMDQAGPARITAILHNNLGTSLRYLGRYEEAFQHFQGSLELGRQLNDPMRVASARLNIGILLQDDLQDYSRAADSLQRSLADFEAFNKPDYVAKCLTPLGNNAYYGGDHSRALEYYRQALALDQWLSYNDRAILYKNLGRIYLEQKQYDSALEDLNQALAAFQSLGNDREIAATIFETGNVYFEQADFAAAIRNYEQALAQNPQDPLLKSRILFFLSAAYDQMNQPELASRNKSQYIELQDSLYANVQESMKFQLQLEDERNERIVAQLELEQEKKQKMQAYTLIAFGVMWLFLGLAVMGFYLSRQKRRIAEQREHMAQQEMVNLLKEKELEANYAWLEGQEETRRRIGKDLHDGLGSMLTTVKLYFSGLDSRLDALQEESRQQYQKANSLLDEACEEVRRVSHEMMSAILVKFGLKAQIEALAETIRDISKLQVELSTHGLNDRLETKLEFKIYRMVQELVNNAIKHARASRLTIQVNRFEDVINLMVEDNGAGFDPEKAKAKDGMGMKNLAARVNDLDGTLHIDSRPGHGTTVAIDIPISDNFQKQNEND